MVGSMRHDRTQVARVEHRFLSISDGRSDQYWLPATRRRQGPHHSATEYGRPALLHRRALHNYPAVIASTKCDGANVTRLLMQEGMQ
jgi:hypothetical protein